MAKILAINAGSSTLKWQLFSMPEEIVLAKGLIDRMGMRESSITMSVNGQVVIKRDQDIPTIAAAVAAVMNALKESGVIYDLNELKGVGHRIVAGGEVFSQSAILDHRALAQVDALAEYAPLHNPPEAAAVRAFAQRLPKVPQVGVFDTAFHATMPPVNYRYAIKQEYYDQFGARKYGAHGTSHRYVASRAAALLKRPLAQLNLVSMHLGSGASVTAIKNGQSFDTSMGFTPVAGLAMSTRSGDIDPSLVLFLMQKMHLRDPQKMIDILNRESGLLALSELSPDMRELQASAPTDAKARLALDVFNNRVIKYVAGYLAELGHADGLIFTAGIGEHDPDVREAVISGLSIFGVKLDAQANLDPQGETCLSTPDSTIPVFMIPTNEELMIARDVMQLV
ncbi:acetate/propionate family kinase [Lacticaseibacillus sp. N501-2]|uniref:acetate/propionate family kinase n=1 Tax=Lacticaseibacillus salsurae TaxID=3367729 RepID=UPI0038B2D07A